MNSNINMVCKSIKVHVMHWTIFLGGLCIMWYFAWLCFVFEKPSHDPSISQSEYEYIIKNQGKQNIEYEVNIPFI